VSTQDPSQFAQSGGSQHSGGTPASSGGVQQGGPPAQSGGSRQGRGFRGTATLVVAVLALFLAFLSTVLSWRASGKADDNAKKIDALVAAQGAAPGPTAQQTTEPPTTTEPTDQATTEPGNTPTNSPQPLSPQTQFELRYPDRPMRIPGGCSDSIYVDFDQPAVQVDSRISELYFDGQCGNTTPRFHLSDGVKATEIPSEVVKPGDCANPLNTSPLSANAAQPVRKGQVFCILTSPEAASESAMEQKLIIFSITGTTQDGAVTLKASAWAIPS